MSFRHDVVLFDSKDYLWYEIPEFPEYYASPSGYVTHHDRLLKPHIYNEYGHCQIRFYKNGKQYTRDLHRLIAELFIPNPEGYPLVRHLDGDPINNDVNNLAWGTYKDNAEDSIRHGTFRYRPRTFTSDELARSINTNRTPVEAIDIVTGERLSFRSQAEAARKLGLSQGNIAMVLSGRRSRTGNYIFKYLPKEVY